MRAHAHEGIGAGQGEDQVSGFLFHPLVLVRNGQFGARLVQTLRDRPSDAALVGHSKHDRQAAFETRLH